MYKINGKISPNSNREKAQSPKQAFGGAKYWFGFALSVVLFWGAASAAQAASLYFSPASGTYVIGSDTLKVGVLVSTTSQAMNAVSGTVQFPIDKLEVTSISREGTIMSLWVQEPSFSNASGTFSFEGVVLNPGYTGGAGKIITVNFKIKNEGQARLAFTSGAILANDGQGTNILSNLDGANFTLIGKTPPFIPPSEPAPAPVRIPEAARINSATHPDPQKWYANNDPAFSWSAPQGVDAVSFSVDREATTDPGTRSDGLRAGQSYRDFDEGVWYFHLRMRNAVGWGAAAHFRFQIDTRQPERFDISIAEERPQDPTVRLKFDASDKTSGIDFYEIAIDDGNALLWRDDGSGLYPVPAQSPGTHTAKARVFDKAGNSLESSIEFQVAAFLPPTISDYPGELRVGDTLIVKGLSPYPRSQITGWAQGPKEGRQSVTSQADEQGGFTLVFPEKMRVGKYKVWAEVIDEYGVHSEPSKEVTVKVRRPALSRRVLIGGAIIIMISLLILVISLFLLYLSRKVSRLKKKVRKEAHEAQRALHAITDEMKEKMRAQIKKLERARSRRELTQEEERVIAQLKDDLDRAARTVEKEIEDIEEEVK